MGIWWEYGGNMVGMGILFWYDGNIMSPHSVSTTMKITFFSAGAFLTFTSSFQSMVGYRYDLYMFKLGFRHVGAWSGTHRDL